MPRLTDQITIESDAFEHREAKPHFINPCCFGEDIAAWLKGELKPLEAEGFEISEPVQEDYGWGLWASKGKDAFWVAIGFQGDGPTEEPGVWGVSVDDDPGPNVLKRMFHKPDGAAFTRLRDRIWQILRADPRVRIVPEDEPS